jgi:hypothetical protein
MQFSAAPAPARSGCDPFAAIAAVLWGEREILEQLLYTLVQQQLVLSTGQTRWLNRADAQVRAAVDELRTSEVLRAAEVEALAAALDLPPESTLAELAALAPEPWPPVLTEHRDALRALVAEIDVATQENRRLLQTGASAVLETMERHRTW